MQLFCDSRTCTLNFNNSFFDRMADEIVPYQDEDAWIHDDWVRQSAGGSRGSNPNSRSPLIHRWVGEASGFDQEFFPLGGSKGSQSQQSRRTRGSQRSQRSSGNRGRVGSGRSIGSSNDVHAASHSQHFPPTSPARRTLPPPNHAH